MADEKQKAKATRTVKPVFALMTVTNDAGEVLDVTKENVTILGIYKNAEELLEVMDSGKAPGSFFKKIQL
jgi:hypothetical protein